MAFKGPLLGARGFVRLTSGYTFNVLEEVEVLMTRKAFADFVARARDALDMTQKELGDAVDVDAQQVSRWENGRSLPSSRKLRRLAEALKLTGANLVRFYELHSSASEEDKATAVRGNNRVLSEVKDLARQVEHLAADVAEIKRALTRRFDPEAERP